jgi:hypothetical protein
MGEGLSATEVGKEIAQHAKHGRGAEGHAGRDTLLIVEAALLSIVTLLAAWSGYAAAKWNTESRVTLAEASAARSKANRADLQAMELRNFDSSTFEAWFAAYATRNEQAMAIAERRFRPQFGAAFDAWRATKPETNPNAPRGPTYMPQYRQPGLARATTLDGQADEAFAKGSTQGTGPTSTSGRPSSSRACSSSSASAHTFRSAACATRSSVSAGRCSFSRSFSWRNCRGRRADRAFTEER